MADVLVGTAQGHAAIRATHAKTLEFERDAEIGARATCVVGVGAAFDEAVLEGPLGEVELLLSAAGVEEVVRGRLNPAFRPGMRLVARCSDAVAPDAILIGADKGAAALDRRFVDAVRDGAAVEVRLRHVRVGPGVAFVHMGPPWGPALAAPEGDVVQRLRRGGRVDLPSESEELVEAAFALGATVLPAPGQSPVASALACVGAGRRPVLVGGDDTPAGHAIVRTGTAEALVAWLSRLSVERACLGVGGRWTTTPKLEGERRAAAVAAVVMPSTGATSAEATALAASGATTAEVAAALRKGGMSRNAAYAAALALVGDAAVE
jgi:hypothetical protein